MECAELERDEEIYLVAHDLPYVFHPSGLLSNSRLFALCDFPIVFFFVSARLFFSS